MNTPARGKAWRYVRLAGSVIVVAGVVHVVGGEPFLAGVRAIDVSSILAAAAITALATLCCAWRWRLVAAGLGAHLSLRTAFSAYYRSQFLDATLPGGVLGDVYRGVQRGRSVHHVGRGLRVVFWERLLGQLVQLAMALAVLIALPSPLPRGLSMLTAAVLALIVILAWMIGRRGPARWLRSTANATAELRGLSRRAWFGIALASCGAVVGYVTIFLIAVDAVGAATPLVQALPLVLLILVAAAIPVNIAGFGPREGVAAWAFAAAGLGADQGVAAATAYGVLGLISCVPGAALLFLDWMRSKPSRCSR